MYQYGLALTDADFQKLFVEPVKQKFPYITLELVRVGDGTQPEDLIASGDFPNILFSSNPSIPHLIELGALADLTPFVKQYNTLTNAFKCVNLDGQDINTALRTAQEAANKTIQEKKAQ